METVTLRGEDFKTIHNTLCELRSVQERITGVVSNDIADSIHKIIKGFEAGLKDAYEQDEATFDDKMEYYSEFRGSNLLRSIWSVYELPLHGFAKAHPFPSDAFIVYKDHWGDNKDTHYPVMGDSWGDVYRAADLAIRESGDEHHIFIEGFDVKGNELRLYTGS